MLIKEYGKAKARLLRRFGLEPANNVQPAENGEYAFLRHIRNLPEVMSYNCIVDVGAHVGDWTSQVMEQFKNTSIENFLCVEPIPKLAQHVKERFASNPKVQVFETALSDERKEKAEIFDVGGGGRMHHSYRGNANGAGDKKPMKLGTKKIVPHTISVTTGDDLLGQSQYRPYLIKIDCDGHDLRVLRGFKSTILKTRPLIQFEYCDFWIGGHSRLRDACRFLYAAGYNTYKLFPDRLVRFHYNPLFETFGYQNIVTAPKEFSSLSDRMLFRSPE